MVMLFRFGCAFITTATAPPPEDASTVVSSRPRRPQHRRPRRPQPRRLAARLHPLQVERVVEADRQHVALQRLHLTGGVEQRRELLIALPAGLANPRPQILPYRQRRLAWARACRRARRDAGRQ